MRRRIQSIEDLVVRTGVVAVGGVLLASAGLAADLARDHMLLLGTICSAGPAPHCGWCYGAAGLALSGFAAFALALRPHDRGLVAA
jgi:hypothetical protein